MVILAPTFMSAFKRKGEEKEDTTESVPLRIFSGSFMCWSSEAG
jgi:hypothetical protein